MNTCTYTVVIQPADEGGFTVTCPALLGCVSEGETREEALEMIRDAIAAYLACLRKHGEPVPPTETVTVEVDEA